MHEARQELYVTQFTLPEMLHLHVTPEKLCGIEEQLGPDGIGTFLIPNVLRDYQLERMWQEVSDPFAVPWRDNHDRFVNQRGIEVVENHDVFALKLRRGDDRWIQRVPHMRAMATNIENLVRSLSGNFPTLATWTADEMSLHRYDDADVGLSFHKDNLRFSGLIGVLTLEGASDFQIRDDNGKIYTYATAAGDLVLTRATGLYDAPAGENLCPEHAVVNLKTDHRTSFIVRANSRPDEPIPGFAYDNWGPVA